MAPPPIRFCRLCGAPTTQRVPALEDRPRAVCTACGYVDYVNPINVVGTVPVWWEEADGPRILLCRRSIEPRAGFWTLPAGFLEVGETSSQGASRETLEEAGARVEIEGLFSVIDLEFSAQLHVYYRARLLDLDLAPGPETIENLLVRPSEIPWDDLAFRTVRRTLEFWTEDLASGAGFGVHHDELAPPSSELLAQLQAQPRPGTPATLDQPPSL